MHILLIHQSFVALDEPGGTRHHELARYLAEHGHQVTIIASRVSYLTGTTRANTSQTNNQPSSSENLQSPDQSSASISSGESAGITILHAYTYSALHRSFVHRILAFVSFMLSSFVTGLGVRKVDLVWGTSPPIFQGLTAWALARIKRVPFLFEVRDLWPAFAIGVGVLRQPTLIKASEWLERFLYRRADTLMVNSPGFIEHVKARGARRVELVPNGADSAMFDPEADGADFRREHALEGKFITLYAGAHGLSNDLGVVLEAASLLRDQPEIAIVFVGDGKEKPALQARAVELKLTNVVFIPPVPKNAMPSALAAADACIGILKPVPMYATVYPNKIFDYMAAGRPVVLAMQGVIRAVVEKAGAGIPVPPGDARALAEAIQILAAQPEMGREMGANGRRCVQEQFDRSVLAEKLMRLVESLVISESL